MNDPQILTADQVPLERLMEYGDALTDQFEATADRRFEAVLGQEVNQRTFQQRTGEINWRKVSEAEKPRTGSLSTTSMAFTIDEFNAGLGWTRNYVEDNPESLLRQDMEELMKGADERMFEETFSVVQNGIADGTEVEWATPPEPGARDFGGDHNHVFPSTSDLFGDTDPYTAREHIARGGVELQHHKYNADVAFVSPDFAWKMLQEDSNNVDYQIREARDLLTTPLPEIQFNVNGTRVLQTAELTGDTVYLFDSSLKPLYYNWVRPVELANDDQPVSKPSELIGAEGSARFGISMVNPWAGVEITADNFA